MKLDKFILLNFLIKKGASPYKMLPTQANTVLKRTFLISKGLNADFYLNCAECFNPKQVFSLHLLLVIYTTLKTEPLIIHY
jgi:hypothetical protein